MFKKKPIKVVKEVVFDNTIPERFSVLLQGLQNEQIRLHEEINDLLHKAAQNKVSMEYNKTKLEKLSFEAIIAAGHDLKRVIVNLDTMTFKKLY